MADKSEDDENALNKSANNSSQNTSPQNTAPACSSENDSSYNSDVNQACSHQATSNQYNGEDSCHGNHCAPVTEKNTGSCCKSSVIKNNDNDPIHKSLKEFGELNSKLYDTLEKFVLHYDEAHVRRSGRLSSTTDDEEPTSGNTVPESPTVPIARGVDCDDPLCKSVSEMWRSTNGKTYESVWADPKCMQISSHESDLCYFDFIPVELIIKIFSFLTTQELCRHVSPVCRKWRQLSYDQSLWKFIDFSESPHISTLDLLWVIRRAPLLQRLNLTGRASIKRAEVAILTECCPGLLDIDFGFCDSLNSDMIKTVSENCRGIRRLNVEGCEKVDHRAVRYIARMKRMTHMNFSHCVLQDTSIKYLAEKLNNITSINLDGIADITDK